MIACATPANADQPDNKRWPEGREGRGAVRTLRGLTPGQIAAVRSAMQLFVEDDLARGVPDMRGLYCGACDRIRPSPGFIHYKEDGAAYPLCNACATAYELARLDGEAAGIEQYLHELARAGAAFG